MAMEEKSDIGVLDIVMRRLSAMFPNIRTRENSYYGGAKMKLSEEPTPLQKLTKDNIQPTHRL